MRITDLLSLSPPLGFAQIVERRVAVVSELTAARARREALLLADDTDADVLLSAMRPPIDCTFFWNDWKRRKRYCERDAPFFP
jgi:hypothetical protein